MSSVSLPSDWNEEPLSELVDHFDSGVSVNSDENHATAEHWILKTSCVNGGKFDPYESKPIPASEVSRAELHPKADSILVSRMNTFALVGETAYVPDDVEWAFVPDRLWQTVIQHGKDTHVRWLSYVLQSPSFRQQVSNSATGTSGSMKNISQGLYLGIDVRIPPLPEQRKIARILTTLDNLIEKTEALIAKYQSIKQGMMHDLFTRGVDSSGQLRPTHEQAPDLYKQSELGWIPKEWEIDEVQNVLSRIIDYRGKTPTKTGSGVPLITAKNVRMGYIDDEPREFISERDYGPWMTRGIPRIGDVLFTTEAPLGNVAQLDTSDKRAFAQRMIILQAGERVIEDFLKYLLMTEQVQTNIRKRGSGSTVEGIKQSQFRLVKVAFPTSKDEQHSIAAKLDQLDKQIDAEQMLGEKHKESKSGLMQDLLTGKVRVKVDEAEEACAHA